MYFLDFMLFLLGIFLTLCYALFVLHLCVFETHENMYRHIVYKKGFF